MSGTHYNITFETIVSQFLSENLLVCEDVAAATSTNNSEFAAKNVASIGRKDML